MEKEKKSRKRLILNIDPELHKKIKIHATQRNMSITDYVTQVLVWRLSQEK